MTEVLWLIYILIGSLLFILQFEFLKIFVDTCIFKTHFPAKFKHFICPLSTIIEIYGILFLKQNY